VSTSAKAEKPSSNVAPRGTGGNAVEGTVDEPANATDTPMVAVWIALGAILIAGLYGLIVGMQATSKKKVESQSTSMMLGSPCPIHSSAARRYS